MVSKYIAAINRNNIKILFISFNLIFLVGCTVANMFPSKTRDQWYMEHGKELRMYTETMERVRVGMTKEEVLLIAGKPTYTRSEDVLHKPVDEWIYANRYFVTRYYVTFENGKVTDIRSH